jgi:hypothetical protein
MSDESSSNFDDSWLISRDEGALSHPITPPGRPSKRRDAAIYDLRRHIKIKTLLNVEIHFTPE